MRNSRMTRPQSPAPLFRSNTSHHLLCDQAEQSMKDSVNNPTFQLPSPMLKQQLPLLPTPGLTQTPISSTTMKKSNQPTTATDIDTATATQRRPPIQTRRSSSTGTSSLASSNSSSTSSLSGSGSGGRPPYQRYRIRKLPSTRHALLTGSRTLIARLGQAYDEDQPNTTEPSLPLCYLLDEPVLQKDVEIVSADGLHGHIVVCLQESVTNIFKFIYNLR